MYYITLKVEAERRKRAALLESEGIMQVCYVCLNVMAMDIGGGSCVLMCAFVYKMDNGKGRY